MRRSQAKAVIGRRKEPAGEGSEVRPDGGEGEE